jgi:hypothetical protein|tara:strand:- start:47 stop:223 length:177 start_codon:yes stop_codon:yes gene_type:complete
MMEVKTYTIGGYTLDKKNWIEIVYQVDSHTQKFIVFDKTEHSMQFVDLLIEANYKDVT